VRKLVDAVLTPAGRTRVLVVPVDRTASVEQHRALWDAVSREISPGSG